MGKLQMLVDGLCAGMDGLTVMVDEFEVSQEHGAVLLRTILGKVFGRNTSKKKVFVQYARWFFGNGRLQLKNTRSADAAELQKLCLTENEKTANKWWGNVILTYDRTGWDGDSGS